MGGAMACQHAAGGARGTGGAGGAGMRIVAVDGQTADGGGQLEGDGWTPGWLGTEAPRGWLAGMPWYQFVLCWGLLRFVRPSATPSRSLPLLPSLASGVLLYFSGSDSLPSRVEPVRMPRGSCTRSLCASVAFFRFLVSEGSGRGSATMETKKYGHHLYFGAHNASCGSIGSKRIVSRIFHT